MGNTFDLSEINKGNKFTFYQPPLSYRPLPDAGGKNALFDQSSPE
jgi:hypothetical protein